MADKTRKTIDMYPDFGGAYLWNEEGCAIDTDEFGTLVPKSLVEELDNWVNMFDSAELKNNLPDIDWNSFNKKGEELSSLLQDFVKDDYEIIYSKSWEEAEFNKRR